MSPLKKQGPPATQRLPPERSPLKIYTCEYFPKHGGIATYCHELALAAMRDGRTVEIFAPKDARHPLSSKNNYTLTPGPWQGNHSLPALRNIRRLLRQRLEEDGAIHLFPEPGPILALGSLPGWLARAANPILVLHGSEIQRWQRNPVAGWLARRAMAAASKTVCVSGPIAEIARAAFPKYAEKFKAVPNALPHAYFSPGAPGPPANRSPDDPCRLLSVGRFHPRKGFDQILRALARLPTELKTRVHYTIVGGAKSASYLQSLRDLAAANAVMLDCRVDATAEAMQAAYREAHLFALTSVPQGASIEGFGLVYLEAGAFGLPCLAYDNGGVRDAVRHGETGYLVKTGDVDALAERLAHWIEHPEQAAAMGAANQRFALSRSWDDVLAAILKPR